MPAVAASTTQVHDVTILNRVLWMSPLQRAEIKRHEQAPAKRINMNPNRLMAGLLSAFDGQFFSARLKVEVKQSNAGVLNVDKESVESALKLVFGRIVAVASQGSTLSISWSRKEDRLCLRLALTPAAAQRPGSVPLALLPQSSPLRQRLKEAGVQYESATGNGPWEMSFDTLYI